MRAWQAPLGSLDRLTPASECPPALGLIEVGSIAIGYLVLDTLVKKAPVTVLQAQTASPGRFITMFSGTVAEVEESHAAGIEAAGDQLVDHLLLANAHADILPALSGQTRTVQLDSLGIVETFSYASALLAADVAAKAASVLLIEIRPPIGLGGKSFVSLSGPLEELQYSLEAAVARVRPQGMLCRHVVIANPHEEISPFVF